MKFSTYNARNRLYQQCKDLRDIPANMFINEDLTKKRSKLLFSARTLASADLLKAVYSTDGKILIRDINNFLENISSSVRFFPDDCVLNTNVKSKIDCQILQDDLNSLAQLETDWQMKCCAMSFNEGDPAPP